MTRAPFVMRKSEEAFDRTPADRLRHDARLALREPADGGALPAAVDGRDGRERGREVEDRARGAGRLRARVAEEGRRRRRGAARSSGRLPGRRSPGRRGRPSSSTRTSGRAPTRRWRRSPELPAVFRKGGTVTAGNSSPLNDGASARAGGRARPCCGRTKLDAARAGRGVRDGGRRAELHGRGADSRDEAAPRPRRLARSAIWTSSS